jgi:hypothetical protein
MDTCKQGKRGGRPGQVESRRLCRLAPARRQRHCKRLLAASACCRPCPRSSPGSLSPQPGHQCAAITSHKFWSGAAGMFRALHGGIAASERLVHNADHRGIRRSQPTMLCPDVHPTGRHRLVSARQAQPHRAEGKDFLPTHAVLYRVAADSSLQSGTRPLPGKQNTQGGTIISN